VVHALDRHRRVTALPFQQPEVPETYGLTVTDCELAAWAIAPDFAPQSAAAVMLTLSVALGIRVPWSLYRLPVIRQALEAFYTLVARNRHRLPGDPPYCDQFPEECGAPKISDF
jgi:hypothetical protein